MKVQDLGVNVEELTWRREVHLYKVDDSNGVSAMIVEEAGRYTVHFTHDVLPVESTPRYHESMKSALDEVLERSNALSKLQREQE